MENDDEYCNTGLCLGLGMGGHVARKEKKQKLEVKNPLVACFDLAFELCPKGEDMNINNNNNNNNERFSLERQYYPNAITCSTDSDNNINNNNDNDRRKKLRLTKDQSAMLENTFKLHNTLNPVIFIPSYSSHYFLYFLALFF